jgi:hypothetical protein
MTGIFTFSSARTVRDVRVAKDQATSRACAAVDLTMTCVSE